MCRDQLLLHVAGLDGRDRATQRLHPVHLGTSILDQLGDLGLDDVRAVEDVVVLEQVGLVGQHLLQPQRPLLVPGPGQAERLVPGGELDGAGAGVLAERHAQHLEHDPGDVVLRLRLGQPERVDLDAVPETPHLVVGDAVSVAGDLVPELDEGAHLAGLLDEADPRIDEERDPADDLPEVLLGDLTGVLHLVEHRDRGAQRVGELLPRRGACLLQVVAADVDRVPLRDLVDGVGDDVGDQPQRVLGREHVGATGEVLLDDVVLGGAGELVGHLGRLHLGVLLLRDDLVEGQQPHRGGVDRHRGVHLGQRDLVEEAPHLAEVRHRDADLADLTAAERVLRVVAGLGRQVEGDREPGLTLRQVGAVERVRRGRGRVAGVRPHDPGAVLLAHGPRVGPGATRG